MFDLNSLKNNTGLKKSKSLMRISEQGKEHMYKYLSGLDDDSTYTADNIKHILSMQGNIDWNQVSDKTNALFSMGYSDQGNIIGILTNTNAMLQDMLLYCPIEEARQNLSQVLTLDAGSRCIPGKRYSVDGKSPLTFSLPVITKSGYRTYAAVIHKLHSERFEEIIKELDLSALTEEDMLLIANDFSFLSRTQELAIDVAKDKTIEIVDTSLWLNVGIKPKNYHLSKQKNSSGWYAKDNLDEIINAKKTNNIMPDFRLDDITPDIVKEKVRREVVTSDSLVKEVLVQAVKDFFNIQYKEMLLYSQETILNQEAKAKVNEHPELALAISKVLTTYRGYVIDNIPKGNVSDEDTAVLLSKIIKEKLAKFASICRNTIYRLAKVENLNGYSLALLTYGVDLTMVSKDEGKFFRAIMPEEFKKLYSQEKEFKEKEKLFFVDDFVKDMMDDGEEIVVNFVDGKAYDEQGILIAKASHKYNAVNAKLILDERSGRYYAERSIGISISPIGNEVIIPLCTLQEGVTEVMFSPSLSFNNNVLFTQEDTKVQKGLLGDKLGQLTNYHRYMLVNNENINRMAAKRQYDYIDTIINNYSRVETHKLFSLISIKERVCINKDSNFEAHYAIITIR